MHWLGDIVDFNDNTLIMMACNKRDYNSVEVLLDLGFDLNAKNKQGNTALHFANQVKHWNIVDL
eukprot:CAMPEP_0170567470 /NCGR_PEP_ID=MMETSP0211-20121228/80503_1 /TAXON_ID=311385 /ORGANISM="Pseudokeronopsis sp., Strain OXSARD2" /LENGTH=63 /DNA_ID=CAMNT_0010888939 /DNA_START=748 /DNA_END=936 /DNA_ORIENTATION=+